MVIIVMIAPVANKLLSYWWNHLIRPLTVTTAPIVPVSDHSGKWLQSETCTAN